MGPTHCYSPVTNLVSWDFAVTFGSSIPILRQVLWQSRVCGVYLSCTGWHGLGEHWAMLLSSATVFLVPPSWSNGVPEGGWGELSWAAQSPDSPYLWDRLFSTSTLSPASSLPFSPHLSISALYFSLRGKSIPISLSLPSRGMCFGIRCPDPKVRLLGVPAVSSINSYLVFGSGVSLRTP